MISTHQSSSIMVPTNEPGVDLVCPFGKLEGLNRGDFCEAAYEIFFASCRASPVFGGRNAISCYNSSDGGDGSLSLGSPRKSQGVGMAVTSRVKMTLGLKVIKKPSSRRTSSIGCIAMPSTPDGCTNSPRAFSTLPLPRARRPLTSAEIMRQQMRVAEPSDNRLRKTLMRTLVGQMGRRAETIILPLELLRHLKPSEFRDPLEYHEWQKRQLKILEAGLLRNPSIPLGKRNTSAKIFREIVQSCETKALDTGKNSEAMKSLCQCVVSLSLRSHDGSQTDVCHWADGYPLNIHIYVSLVSAIFDLKDQTLVLDEVDELLELIKKTWNIIGINRSIHNLCFTWVLFEQYVVTGQVEPDLLGATLVMLNEVATDAKKADREPIYVKMLAYVLLSMKKWAEMCFFDYHRNFHKGTIGLLENILPLVLSVNRILDEDVRWYGVDAEQESELKSESFGNKVDHYIRTSLKNAFAKMLEFAGVNEENVDWQGGNILIKMAKATEDLALKEKEAFSPSLKKWHPIAGGVAAVTLHSCYGNLLKQYLTESSLSSTTVLVLESAGRLEKSLIQMIVEDSEECEDGGKAIVREMVPYEVDSIMLNLIREWIQERLKTGKDIVARAKENETWKPKSKDEPYTQSATELVHNAKEAIENFFKMPVGISDDFAHDLTHGLELLFEEYITFISSCGSKHNYIPTLPPLTRCSNGSKFTNILKRAASKVGTEDPPSRRIIDEGKQSRLSTSRGTQRLYIRINTLHYLISQLHFIDKTIVLYTRGSPSRQNQTSDRQKKLITSSYFDHTCQAIQVALQHVAEIAAYRLIFLDSSYAFYENLYACGVANARISPVLKITKQNLTLLCAIVTDKAQPLALKEVMKASFEAYLMVLLAGGNNRLYTRTDHEMIEEDFERLKRIFCTCGEGLIAEDLVGREAEIVDGIIALMGQPTEQVVEDLCIVACEAREVGNTFPTSNGLKLAMTPTSRRWNRSDPNTILRVLCYRNDSAANNFLKRTFQLPRRRV